MVRVLLDGWTLVNQPGGAAARHLHTLLASLDGDTRAVVAAPAAPAGPLPGNPEVVVPPASATPAARLAWEQRTLPALVKKTGATVLHLTTPTAPLWNTGPVLLSSTGDSDRQTSPGFTARVRLALAAGGMARLSGLVWPDDLPEPANPGMPIFRLPPLVELPVAGEAATAANDLPEAYILYAGAGDEISLRRLADAWSWAAGPLGSACPLLVAGLNPAETALLKNFANQRQLGDSLRILPHASPPGLQRLVQNCTVFFHPAQPGVWGSLLRLALACGRPVVGLDDPITAGMAGRAAYLVHQDDPRGLGAALISVMVDADLADSLSREAARQAAGWQTNSLQPRLSEIYRLVAAAG